ncbi:unnamed protein product [Bathycoccus prasinos]
MRSSAERMIETFAKWYTPIVILAALLYGVIPVLISTDNAKESLYTACVLLVIACPCALVLSTPVVSVCGLTVCAKRGVVVKGSQFLERLGQLKTMYIDKTGTLTTGTFEMTEVKLATPPSEDASTPRPALGVGATTLGVCGGVEIVAPVGVCDSKERGCGCSRRGETLNFGNEKLAEKKLWTLSDLKLYETAIRWETEIGATVVWVGINGKLGGILKAEDSLRPSAKDAIAKLQKSSIDVIILTGDNKGAAEMCAKNVGIDVHTNVFSSLTPNEKLNRITEEVQKQEKELVARKKTIFRTSGRGTIAMVGDGISDAPALSAADVGVAMGVAGTAAAMETAPVALLTNDLSRLADTIYIGRRCVLKIRQNIFFSVTTKLVVLGLTFAGLAGLWQAVVVDVGSALVVIFNGMSILREAEKDDARRNKISHEIGVKFAEEEKEKQKLLAERQQVHIARSSQQVHYRTVIRAAPDHSCCDHDKEEGKKTVPPSPCFSQGLCLDPTVIELLDDGSNNNTKGGESLFLIEGQLVKSVGEEWKATSLVYSRTTTVKKTKEEEEFEDPLKKRSKEEDDDDELLDGTRRLSGEQPPKTVESSTTDDTSATAAAGGGKTPHPLIALGLPADVEEAKAYLKRINAETIPHGNHRDFLRTEDKKKKKTKRTACAGATAEEQHGGSGKRFSNVEDHGRIEAVIRRQRKGHEQNLGGGDYVPLQRSSARANGKENESKEEEEREENQKDTVVDIRQIVEHERRGGNEVASQTRFKVEGICCPSEVPLIHNILDSMSGVRDVKVIVPTKMVLVEHAANRAHRLSYWSTL